MSKPQITRLTKEELAAGKSSSAASDSAAVVSAPITNRASLYSTEYITKLSIDDTSLIWTFSKVLKAFTTIDLSSFE